ncbi:DUF523 domain-containing protein [Gluconacetobacter takamatsuzukensis]|uniref:DUF523 domain-containing protein n=1 Tax=Gluconacetobacter takamatsuzukensis TaxID=1286190 RepID=A0A7W4KEN6_9PROT|nr:DUF523 domain-containing protein [Gluconacetobacter takamatsuzukensis]MBB2205455.1 DUF523 domain-containing protein [Gluconacetobacter takamatsuzukensis]
MVWGAMENAKILISACLLGQPVRYDGGARPALHPALDRWREQGRLVVVCPELAAGFGVPRPPAEIAEGQSGPAVLAGTARVIEAGGGDVSAPYVAGAEAALALARAHGCAFAILTDGSPSCGSAFIYDGSFGGRRHAGMGVTAALLRAHGVEVFAESGIDALVVRLGA